VNKYLYAFLVIVTTALMGSSFAIGKIGLEYVTPILLVGLRFTIAGVLMAIIVKLMKRPHPSSIKDWFLMAVIGFFQTAGVMACIFLSLLTISAGESSILTFMNPLLVVVFGTLFFKAKYLLSQWLGVFLGFIGVFITMGATISMEIGTMLGILSACSWAVATLLIKSWGMRFDTWVLTAYQMVYGGLILLGGSFLLEQPQFNLTATSLFILLWLAIMASIVQFAGWFYLLKIGDPGKTSAFLFLAPFFGVLTGWLLLNEPLDPSILAGGVFIFAGIFLVNWNSTAKVRYKELASDLEEIR
jgi:drug/metabolite transporter (DMT)-like permease